MYIVGNKLYKLLSGKEVIGTQKWITRNVPLSLFRVSSGIYEMLTPSARTLLMTKSRNITLGLFRFFFFWNNKKHMQIRLHRTNRCVVTNALYIYSTIRSFSHAALLIRHFLQYLYLTLSHVNLSGQSHRPFYLHAWDLLLDSVMMCSRFSSLKLSNWGY